MPSTETTERKSKWRARRPGRKPSATQREQNGQQQRGNAEERRGDILRTALAQPHRAGLQAGRKIAIKRSLSEEMRGADDMREATDGCRGPADQRAAYAFGRMRLQGSLTKAQHDALQHWLETFVRYTKTLGLPQVHYGNCLATSVGNAHDGDEPDPKSAASKAIKARRAFEALETVLAEHMGPLKTEGDSALVHVCLMDREPRGGMEGNLRLAANAIDRHLTGHGAKSVDSERRLF